MDYMMHMWFGTYGLSAVSVAVEHCLFGRKAKSKYIEKPILSKIQGKITKENTELTEEEKQAKLDMFVMSLKIMESNFKAEHKNKKGGKEDGKV